jgi:hypothetical protein
MCETTGHLEDEAMPLLPAFLPPRSSLDKVTSFGYTITTRSSFLRRSLFLLKARKIPTKLIESIEGLYATRRILPTVADIARPTPDQKLGVSTWVDSEQKVRLAMPHRYSEVCLFTTAQAKHSLLR